MAHSASVLLDSRPLRRPRISDDIATQLEAAIAKKDYAVGDTLPSERDLMVAFGSGRPAVREALYTLQKLGLIEIRNGARARVVQPNPSGALDDLTSVARHILSQPAGVGHFQQIRALLETGLARLAASSATPEQLERLGRALRANKAAIGNRARFNRTDVEFHFQFADFTGNPIVLAIHRTMSGWLYEQRDVALNPGGMPQTYAQHLAIFEAIVARDPDSAEQAMRTHLETVALNYERNAALTEARDRAHPPDERGSEAASLGQHQSRVKRRSVTERPPA